MNSLFVACCATVLYFAYVNGVVHHNYVNNRFDEFSEDDFNEAFPTPPSSAEDEDTLMLVNVLFRHGNRTADSQAELYPKDPYLNYTYFPYGLGQLTNAGKRREYSIGVNLRTRYHEFMGSYYYPELVEAVSTDYNRTKMSLQLVLAGLFPPRKDDMFAQFVWQPVPFNYLPRPLDRLLLGVMCPRYLELYDRYTASREMQAKFRPYQKTFEYITKNSGVNVRRFQDIYQMYFGISTETEYGLQLPPWLDSLWPDTIIKLSIEEYYVIMGNSNLRKMATGYFLQKMLKDMRFAINSRYRLGRKMHLYSAHENNVAQLLIALGVFEPHIPNYGAHVILELHRIKGQYGVKVLYDNWTGEGARLLTIPGCTSFCPLNKFVSLIDEHMPIDQDLCGN